MTKPTEALTVEMLDEMIADCAIADRQTFHSKGLLPILAAARAHLEGKSWAAKAEYYENTSYPHPDDLARMEEELRGTPRKGSEGGSRDESPAPPSPDNTKPSCRVCGLHQSEHELNRHAYTPPTSGSGGSAGYSGTVIVEGGGVDPVAPPAPGEGLPENWLSEVVADAKTEVASWPDWKKPAGLAPPAPGEYFDMATADRISTAICKDLDLHIEAIPVIAKHLVGLCDAPPAPGEGDECLLWCKTHDLPARECDPVDPDTGELLFCSQPTPIDCEGEQPQIGNSPGVAHPGEVLFHPLGGIAYFGPYNEGDQDFEQAIEEAEQRPPTEALKELMRDDAKLVERLRAWATHNGGLATESLCNEAATALEALRKENDETYARLVGDAEGYGEHIEKLRYERDMLKKLRLDELADAQKECAGLKTEIDYWEEKESEAQARIAELEADATTYWDALDEIAKIDVAGKGLPSSEIARAALKEKGK